MNALAHVESGQEDEAFNEKEGAYGRFQMRQLALDDANEFAKTDYSLEEMKIRCYAYAMFRAYIMRWSGRWETLEDLCCLWNAGPKWGVKGGIAWRNMLKYTAKVMKEYNK